MSGIVTLTTDFQDREPYAASAKGVLYSRCPGVHVVDLSHEIPRQDVREGALFVAGALPYFPKGTIHIVSVDAGAQPLVVTMGGQIVLCPDNGVITMLAGLEKIANAYVIAHKDVIPTHGEQIFYAREVFAPAAAMLLSGMPPKELGPHIEHVAFLQIPAPRKKDDGQIVGEILHINRFGSLVTNVHRSTLVGMRVKKVTAGYLPIEGLSQSYAAVSAGSPLALFGSSGYIEIAYNGDRADKRLNLRLGNVITVEVEPIS